MCVSKTDVNCEYANSVEIYGGNITEHNKDKHGENKVVNGPNKGDGCNTVAKIKLQNGDAQDALSDELTKDKQKTGPKMPKRCLQTAKTYVEIKGLWRGNHVVQVK